jgi:hypothetical protein
MEASTLQDTDTHFLARMEEATADERDAVFADLAAKAVAGDVLAGRTIRMLLLPACERIASLTDQALVAELVDAAYDEIVDWARREGHVTQ